MADSKEMASVLDPSISRTRHVEARVVPSRSMEVSVEVLRGDGASVTMDANSMVTTPLPARGGLRRFYKSQNDLVSALQADRARLIPFAGVPSAGAMTTELPNTPFDLSMAVYGSFALNVILFIAKLFAAILTGSIAVIASAADSFLDLVSGVVLSLTQRAMAKSDPYRYPQGKSRLEPIGVAIFSAVMGMCSLQIIAEATKRLISVLTSAPEPIEVGPFTIVILSSTIVGKAVAGFYCTMVAKRRKSLLASAYAQDHLNDVLTNTVGVIAVILASKFPAHLAAVDPGGAILIALWIIRSWTITALEQIRKLTGSTAPPDFISRLTHIAYNHDMRVIKIDTVRAYHFGERFLVELDIVLPESMPLRETHDIGEVLQQKLEALEEVERAFVHIDWEWEHPPEHK